MCTQVATKHNTVHFPKSFKDKFFISIRQWWGHIWNTAIQSCCTSVQDRVQTGEASTGPLKWPGSRSTWRTRTGLKNWACVVWRRDGAKGAERSCGYFPNIKEHVGERQIFLRDALWQDKKQLTQTAATEIPVRRWRGQTDGWHNKKQPPLKNHFKRGQALHHCPERLWIPIFGGLQNSAGQGLE